MCNYSLIYPSPILSILQLENSNKMKFLFFSFMNKHIHKIDIFEIIFNFFLFLLKSYWYLFKKFHRKATVLQCTIKNKCGIIPVKLWEQLCVVLKLYADGYVMLCYNERWVVFFLKLSLFIRLTYLSWHVDIDTSTIAT